MYFSDYKILDNPVWNALQTVHSSFALGRETIKRYPSDVLQFVGCQSPGIADLREMESLIPPAEKVFIIGDPAPVPTGWKIAARFDCIQMIQSKKPGPPPQTGFEIVPLKAKDHAAMFDLVSLVQPGYFHKNTPLLGDYFGIRIDDQLVAIAGERLKMTGFTEISAVCTHPSFTGKGFAQQLVHHLVTKNLEAESLPFLHFVTSNTRARNVYELLGFTERKVVPFWQLVR